MALTPGIDTYATVTELQDYATRRGITIAGDPETLLVRAMDYLEVQSFRGTSVDPNQPLHYPTLSDGTPEGVKKAQIVAALLVDSGVDLLAPVGPAVKSETVDVISITYQDGESGRTMYTQLSGLLRPFLGSGGAGVNFEVRRG